MTAGESHIAVEKTKDAYTAKMLYLGTLAKTVSTGNHKFDTLAGFNTGVTCPACRCCGQYGTQWIYGP